MGAQAMLEELGDRRCTVSTFGFGSDHSEDLLHKLAETGGGVYCYVENEDKIGEAFGEALGGLLSVTHQNIQLSLELREGVGPRKAYTKYEVQGPRPSNEGVSVLTIDLGDIYAEEQRDILIELTFPEATEEHTKVLGHVYTRAFAVLTKRSETTAPIEITIARSGDTTLFA